MLSTIFLFLLMESIKTSKHFPTLAVSLRYLREIKAHSLISDEYLIQLSSIFLKYVENSYIRDEFKKELIEETEAATFERAVDYFLDLHPNAYSDTDYSFKRVMMSHER